MVSKDTRPSGHVGTVVEDKGTTILFISGNAGGKALRVDEAPRGTPPAGYRWDKYYDDKVTIPGTTNPTDGTIWVVSVQKTGNLFADLETLSGMPATDPKYTKILDENDLERVALT